MPAAQEVPPHYTYESDINFDELDANGVLHNSRFLVHVERAQSRLFESYGKRWASLADRDPDLRYAVRDLWIEYLRPVTGPGPMFVDLWVMGVGRTSATFGFRCVWRRRACARGRRTVVKIDGQHAPVPWSDWYVTTLTQLKGRHAVADR